MGSDLVTWLRARLDDDEQLLADASRALGALKVHLPGYGPGEPLSITRVLAEVEAKRRILDLHERTVVREAPAFDIETGRHDRIDISVMCELCGWVGDDPTSACETVRLLALPYAANPGFRGEWRP